MALKSKKPLTAEELYALQIQQEQELSRHQRNYTLLAKDRSAISGGNTAKLNKYRNVLKIFRKEHTNILTDLSVATSDTKKRIDNKISTDLVKLLEEYDVLTNQIKQRKTHIDEINFEIKRTDTDVQTLRSKQLTDQQAEDRVRQGHKILDSLENKLEVQIKKFSTISSKNRLLREHILHLLMERKNFLKVWDKLINNLTIGKNFMMDLIEQATIAYDQREEWCSKLQALRTKAHHDLLHHIQEMREFKRKQDNDEKLEEFFRTKGQKRVMKALEAKETFKKRMKRDALQCQLDEYKIMMGNICEFSGNDAVDEISLKFFKQECYNYVLFKYLNDLNLEMEKLNQDISRLYMEIDEQTLLKQSRAKQQDEVLVKLNQELEFATKQADTAKDKLSQADNDLKNLMAGVDVLFKMCRCNSDPLLQLLGQNQTIKDYNMALYQEILEKKVQAVILHVYYDEKTMYEKKKIKAIDRVIQEDQVKPKIYPIERLVVTTPCPLCVEHEQVGDVIDVLQFVLCKTRVSVKLRQRLALPDGQARLHNVSACHLPKSRQIIQKRYQ